MSFEIWNQAEQWKEEFSERKAQKDALLLTNNTDRQQQAELKLKELWLLEWWWEDEEYKKQMEQYKQKYEQREKWQQEIINYILSKEWWSTVTGSITEKWLQVNMTFCGETAANNMRSICGIEAGWGHGLDFGIWGNPDARINKWEVGKADILSQLPEDCKAVALWWYPRAIIDYLKKMDQEKGTNNASKYEQFGHASIAIKMDLDGDGKLERWVIDPYFQAVFPDYIQRIGKTEEQPLWKPIKLQDWRWKTTQMIKPIPADIYFDKLWFELKQGAGYKNILIDKEKLIWLNPAPHKPIQKIKPLTIKSIDPATPKFNSF